MNNKDIEYNWIDVIDVSFFANVNKIMNVNYNRICRFVFKKLNLMHFNFITNWIRFSIEYFVFICNFRFQSNYLACLISE